LVQLPVGLGQDIQQRFFVYFPGSLPSMDPELRILVTAFTQWDDQEVADPQAIVQDMMRVAGPWCIAHAAGQFFNLDDIPFLGLVDVFQAQWSNPSRFSITRLISCSV